VSSHKVFYSVIATGWGIFVGLEAELGNNQADKVIVARKCGLSPEEYSYLVKGLDLVDPSLQVLVTNIEFNECDFQPEGLAMAMATWASEVTGKPMAEIPVFFDRTINRYVFDWPQA
jgi:hypothetical protein